MLSPKNQTYPTSISRMIFAIAESLTVPKSIATVIAEERLVVANATVRIATTALVSQILTKTQIPNLKRRQRWNDLFIFFI